MFQTHIKGQHTASGAHFAGPHHRPMQPSV